MADATKGTVLVVDDDPSIHDAVATSLRYEGYGVSTVSTGRAALLSALVRAPDLVILDVTQPDLDGVEVTRRLRAEGPTWPIPFLTANGTLDHKVTGLSVGGDDDVTKPFALAEIIARTRAILRRTGARPQGDDAPRVADVVMDEAAHEVRRAGVLVHLTATEVHVLRFFMQKPRRVLPKSQFLDDVWHYDFDGDANVVETDVGYLRRKLDKYGPPLICTLRLVGYVGREPERASTG